MHWKIAFVDLVNERSEWHDSCYLEQKKEAHLFNFFEQLKLKRGGTEQSRKQLDQPNES